MSEEQKIVSEAKDWNKQIITSPARKRHERLWFENTAFYEGYQWLEYNSSAQEYLFYRDFNYGKIKTQVNQIQPITDKQIARILRKKPRLTGTPNINTANSELWLVANQLGNVFTYLEDKLQMYVHLYEVMLEAFNCGIGWIAPYWDELAGENVAKVVPIFGKKGEIIGEKEVLINTGDVNMQVYSPFDVIISPSVQQYSNIRRLQTRLFVNPDEIYEYYGKKVEPDRKVEDDSVFGRKYRQLISKVTGRWDVKAVDDVVMKIVEYQLPSKKYPKGRYLVYAGDTILEHKDYLPFGELMFVPFWCKRRHNKFNGDTFIRQLIPPQRQKNRTISVILETLYSHAYPYWAVEKGSGLLKKGIRGEPLQILEYNQGARPPQHVPPPPMPAYVFNTNSLIDQSMMDIASQHDVSKGVNPAGLNNNQALMNLMEADDVTVSLIEQQFYRSYELLGNKIKKIISEGYEEERIIQLSGDNAPNVIGDNFAFSKDSAKKLKDVRIKVEAVPDLPYSRSGKIQLVNDMVRAGLLDPQSPQDKNIIRKIIDFTGVTAELSLDEKNAIRENIGAKEGRGVEPPLEFEDHATHLSVHYQWMKTPEYRALIKQVPEIDQAMMEHTEATKQLIPPPPPEPIPKKVNVNVKAESPEGTRVMEEAGVLTPQPEQPPLSPEGLPPEAIPPEMIPQGVPAGGLPPDYGEGGV